LSLFQFYLATFLVRHATLAPWVIFSPATVNLFRDPQFHRVLFFDF
jgi:hypothetical protein